ncbi:MAG TPA: DinB family protein [Fimbriimonadaceae bacterium]|nr:DinB family protein [Fimbriimonadaceae bacterium]
MSGSPATKGQSWQNYRAAAWGTVGAMAQEYSTRELVVARLASVRAALEEAVSRLDERFLDWVPANGMRTVRGQLLEIVGTEIQFMARLRDGESLAWEHAEARIHDRSLAGLKQELAKRREETLAYIASQPDEWLEQPAGFPTSWQETLGLTDAPVAEVLRGLAQHEAYHTGQLVSYLWARGDDPYQW